MRDDNCTVCFCFDDEDGAYCDHYEQRLKLGRHNGMLRLVDNNWVHVGTCVHFNDGEDDD